MDQKPGNIDQDVRDIVETRAAISQKLELLRQRARYTVDASKASVDHLITHVRDTAQGVLDRAKQGVDPIHLGPFNGFCSRIRDFTSPLLSAESINRVFAWRWELNHVRRCNHCLTSCPLCAIYFHADALRRAIAGPEGTTPNERAPTQATPDERNRTQATTERSMREAQAQALYAPPAFVRREEHHRPHETYIGGFGGYTFGGSGFTNTQMFGQPTGGIPLNDSGIYGLKIGHFLPDRLNWLGFEIEGFNTSPNMKPSTGPGGIPVPGASLRVTTVAFNAIIRGKFACGPSRNEPSRRTTTESHRTTTETQRDVSVHEEDTFCPLQPYVGAGLGLFFAHTNGIGGANSSSDNAVPGFNGLAGVRYFFSEHVAMFGEYKYNRATFNFDTVNAAGGLRGDYSVHNIVGGLSFHF